VSWVTAYLPGPGLAVIQNPQRREELAPLVVSRNPAHRSSSERRARGQATSPYSDRVQIAELRSHLRSLQGRALMGAQVAPRIPLALAAELLRTDERGVREMMANGSCVKAG